MLTMPVTSRRSEQEPPPGAAAYAIRGRAAVEVTRMLAPALVAISHQERYPWLNDVTIAAF